MNKLKDEISLEGKLETISMMELRKNPGEIISSVELGKTFIIQRNGVKIATLRRLPGGLSYDISTDGSINYKY